MLSKSIHELLRALAFKNLGLKWTILAYGTHHTSCQTVSVIDTI